VEQLFRSPLPIVLEKGFSFYKQVDDSIAWMYRIAPFELQADFQARQKYVKAKGQDKGQGLLQTARKERHTSSAAKVWPSLTPHARECLYQYYAEDYKVIAELREKACKTDTCRDAIASILKRKDGQL